MAAMVDILHFMFAMLSSRKDNARGKCARQWGEWKAKEPVSTVPGRRYRLMLIFSPVILTQFLGEMKSQVNQMAG